MSIAIYLPLLCSLLLALIAAPAARHVRPALAVWVFTLAAAVGAVTAAWSMVMLAAVLIDDIPAYGTLAPRIPVPDLVSYAAFAGIAVAALRVFRCWARRREERISLTLGANADGVVLMENSSIDAFAVPSDGWRGHGVVYVTRGLLDLLDAAQQEAVLAHESAHLRNRHALARGVVAYAAAAVPLLIPLRHAVDFLCERHADECAVAATGNRSLVARTVAIAALARSGRMAPGVASALNRLAVADRVGALLSGRPARARWQVAVLGLASAATAIAICDATLDFSAIAATVLR
jgi:Zn-dependent protease with chaperone function